MNDSNLVNKKRERFVTIIESRVNKIFDNLDSLGKCSNKKNYEYSEKDIKKIFGEIETKVKEIRGLFQGVTTNQKRFKLE